MNVFIQGMRRNGTTILFDILCEDGRFDCLYEPLAAARKPCIGGGSGVRSEDFFEEIRRVRTRLLTSRPHLSGPEAYNFGAPRDASLELLSEVPEEIEEYLSHLCDRAQDTVIKFTRMARKARVLGRIDPDGVFLHIVRDPRRVVASYLFGKGGKYRDRFARQNLFFESSMDRLPWSASKFSGYLLRERDYSHIREPKDFVRVLMVWKDCFESAWTGGREVFGERYLMLRHEDLIRNPEEVLARIYGVLGKALPESLVEWTRLKLRPVSEVFEPRHSAWDDAFDLLDLWPALRAGGYVAPDCAEEGDESCRRTARSEPSQ